MKEGFPQDIKGVSWRTFLAGHASPVFLRTGAGCSLLPLTRAWLRCIRCIISRKKRVVWTTLAALGTDTEASAAAVMSTVLGHDFHHAVQCVPFAVYTGLATLDSK